MDGIWRSARRAQGARIRRLPGRRLIGAALAVVLAAAPPLPVLAQADRLPDLGAASGDELSGSAERRLGESIMRELRRGGVVYDDAEFTGFLNQFARRLTSTSQARAMSFELFAVREASINAFALPGGYIGVHTGLIAAAANESELATVLGHEIGHVTQRHIARMLSQQRQSSMLSLAGLVLGALAARSSLDAAVGMATLGDSIALRQMLSFSRDAEREADRVGLDILREAQFDVRAAPRFFDRLQQANRYNENNLPVYVRTHPVTGERMTDLQLRVNELRGVDHRDSLEFRLIRARAKAVGSEAVDALRAARRGFEDDIAKAGEQANDPVAWFGLACVAASQRDWDGSAQALERAEKALGSPHVYFERLRIANALGSGRIEESVALSRAILARYPDEPSIIRLRAQALIAGRDNRGAVALLRERTGNEMRADPELWRMLSEAYVGVGERGMAHRAAAESYLLQGLRLPAIEQMRLALKAGDLDFYNGSIVDAKLREQEMLYREELKEQQRRN